MPLDGEKKQQRGNIRKNKLFPAYSSLRFVGSDAIKKRPK